MRSRIVAAAALGTYLMLAIASSTPSEAATSQVAAAYADQSATLRNPLEGSVVYSMSCDDRNWQRFSIAPKQAALLRCPLGAVIYFGLVTTTPTGSVVSHKYKLSTGKSYALRIEPDSSIALQGKALLSLPTPPPQPAPVNCVALQQRHRHVECAAACNGASVTQLIACNQCMSNFRCP
jgi:hypothetical protein